MEMLLSAAKQDALLARLETLEAAEHDARRYRWLRDNCMTHHVAVTVCLEMYGSEWDAAIDEAMGL